MGGGVGITDELILVHNDAGKWYGLPAVVAVFKGDKVTDIICGNCSVCREDEEGISILILDADIEMIKERIKPIDNEIGNVIFE